MTEDSSCGSKGFPVVSPPAQFPGPRSLILPPGRILASSRAEPWEWWGDRGPVARHRTETGCLQQPRWDLPQLLPIPEAWLVRGPVWGQLCGPRQRGPAVCLLKEEKQHTDY